MCPTVQGSCGDATDQAYNIIHPSSTYIFNSLWFRLDQRQSPPTDIFQVMSLCPAIGSDPPAIRLHLLNQVDIES